MKGIVPGIANRFKIMIAKSKHPIVVSDRLVGNNEIMTAAVYHRHGDESEIDVNNHIFRPLPKVDDLLVKIHASGVNPVDVKLRENRLPEWFIPMPKIIGSDMCGTVVEVGANVKENFRIGDKVFAMMPHIWSGWGSAAQYAVVNENIVVKAPQNISDIEAASLPLIGLTVLQGFRQFVNTYRNDTAGRKVLIQAGAGGLGTFAVQYCKHELGMEVYASCSPDNASFVQSLGADVVIDYHAQRFEEVCEGMDVVFDPVAYLYEARTFASKVLHKDSFYIHVASSPAALTPENRDFFGLAIPEAAPLTLLRNHSTALARHYLHALGFPVARYVYQFVTPDGAGLREVAALVESGKVRPVVLPDNIYPLEQTAAAHIKMRGGHVRGKVVIEVSKSD